MRLRRALPLSLVALLAGTGCVSTGGPGVSDVPARGSVPPADAPELPRPDDPPAAAAGSPAPDPLGLPAEPLPLGALPARADADRDGGDRDHGGRDGEDGDPAYRDPADGDRGDGDRGDAPARRAAKAPRAAAERRAKPAAPRRAHPPKAVPAHPARTARNAVPPPPRADELCAAAEGAVPPSIVDLCIRQSSR